jgi:hypothetical protein
MAKHAISLKHPPIVIAGVVWQRYFIGTRMVTVTLPLINFGQEDRRKPSIVVMLNDASCERPRQIGASDGEH